MSVSRIVSAVR